MPKSKKTDALTEKILKRLSDGESLSEICRDKNIPVTESGVRFWVVDDEAFAARYARARSVGWDCRAEQAVDDAKKATDAQLGRLSFDADRWYVGKMKPELYSDKTLLGNADGSKLEFDDTQAVHRLTSILTAAISRDDTTTD